MCRVRSRYIPYFCVSPQDSGSFSFYYYYYYYYYHHIILPLPLQCMQERKTIAIIIFAVDLFFNLGFFCVFCELDCDLPTLHFFNYSILHDCDLFQSRHFAVKFAIDFVLVIFATDFLFFS